MAAKHFESFLLRAKIQSRDLGDPAVSSLLPPTGQVHQNFLCALQSTAFLVKATHPRDQRDWTATILRQCLRVTSEHRARSLRHAAAAGQSWSFLSATHLTHCHLHCTETISALMKRTRRKQTSRQCPKNGNRVHVTVDGYRAQRRQTKPRSGVIFLVLPLCIYFCRVRNIEVLTGVLTAASSFSLLPTDIPFLMIRHHRSASTALVPPFSRHIINVVWSQTCTRKRTVFGTATVHHGAATTGEKESVKLLLWRCRMNILVLLQEAKTRNELPESISAEGVCACDARCFLGFAVPNTLTIQIRYWHGSAGTVPCFPVHHAKMRHNETKERAKNTNAEQVLRALLTDYQSSSEAERPLPPVALPPTLRRQLLLLISRTDSFLKLQAPVDYLVQRRGRVLTQLSSLPPKSSE